MIQVLRTEFTEIEAEAFLRSVNSDLTPDTATSRQVELLMGQDNLDRVQAMGEIPVGGAVITPGGDLSFPFLIHLVTQSSDEPVGRDSIRTALLNGFRRAQEWGLSSLALPPLGTGAGNLEAEDSASVMVPLIHEQLTASESLQEVTIVVSSEYEEDVFRRAVESVLDRASHWES